MLCTLKIHKYVFFSNSYFSRTLKFLLLREANISISKRYIDLFFSNYTGASENEVTLVGGITRKESIKISKEKVRMQINSRTSMLK